MKTLSNGQILFNGKPVSEGIQKGLKLTSVKKFRRLKRKEMRKVVKALTRDCDFSFTCQITPECRRQLQEMQNEEQIIKYERVKAFLSTHQIIPYEFIKNVRYDKDNQS